MRHLILTGLLLAMGTQFAHAKPRNISFISHRTSATKVDVGDPGLSVGDMVANTGELLDIRTNAVIGSFAGRHIVIAADLPGGTVTSVIIVQFNTGTNFPIGRQDRVIVGGTEKYNGAKGIRYTDPVDGKPGDARVRLEFQQAGHGFFRENQPDPHEISSQQHARSNQ